MLLVFLHVTMRIEEAFYNISMYLYIKMSKNMLKLLEVDLNLWFVILKVSLLYNNKMGYWSMHQYLHIYNNGFLLL